MNLNDLLSKIDSASSVDIPSMSHWPDFDVNWMKGYDGRSSQDFLVLEAVSAAL